MIRIYYMKLDGDCSKEQSLALYGMLPKERKESVDRARNQEIAKKRLYTGAFLQYVLSKELGVSCECLQYVFNEWGKPELDMVAMQRKGILDNELQVYFNLSHSGNYAILAVSNGPVGIDIEHKKRGYEALSKRCFCEEEYEDIMAAEPEEDRIQRFLEYWTMKEAYIKWVGEGLRIPLNSFLIKRGEDGISSIVGKTGRFGTYFLDDEYCVSVFSACVKDVEAIVKRRESIIQVSMIEMKNI